MAESRPREPQPAGHVNGWILCEIADAGGPTRTIAHILNGAAERYPGSDFAVVLVADPLPEGWVEVLRRAAEDESTSATASALYAPAGQDQRDSGARSVGNAALHVAGRARPELPAPRVPIAGGPVVYLVRGAFDLLGGFDESLPTSAGALADYSLRARAQGLANLATSELLTSSDPMAGLVEEDRRELSRRHPALWPAANDPPSSAIERAIPQARHAHGAKITVTIDARTLTARTAGTQVYTRELLRALDATGEVRLRALLGGAGPTSERLDVLEEVETLSYDGALAGVSPSDIVHRPQQLFTTDDLNLLRPLGRRFVLTHLDLIAYHNPTYFATLDHWRRHVRATRIALDIADQVLFLSASARLDAEREDLIDSDRTSVAPMGVDANDGAGSERAVPLPLNGRREPFLLCLGSDYLHKNRPFALELTLALRKDEGWPGLIVLAGAHAEHGSSAQAERQLLDREPELAGAVVDLGPVSDAQRGWLLSNAAAVVYPSVLEGFGLIPFEAAAAGTPCLFARQSALAELLPAEAATLRAWSARASATAVLGLLIEGDERARHIAAVREASRHYTWARCAELTLERYEQALSARTRSSARAAWEAQEREREIVRLDRAVKDGEAMMRDFRESLGPDALLLVGDSLRGDAGLLSRADQRALLAVAARRPLRRGLFAGLRGGYRILHRGRQ